MGLFDNVLSRALPGGDLAKPVGAALLALLAYKASGGSLFGNQAGQQGGPAGPGGGVPPAMPPEHQMPGILAGGLGGLLEQFQRSGYGDKINSWIGNGPNRQIRPDELNEALGPDTVDQLSRQTGMGHHDLLSQLAQALPQVVDRLTPQGRIPNEAELSRQG